MANLDHSSPDGVVCYGDVLSTFIKGLLIDVVMLFDVAGVVESSTQRWVYYAVLWCRETTMEPRLNNNTHTSQLGSTFVVIIHVNDENNISSELCAT